MKTIRMSATEARNNFFDLLNQVLYEGVQVIIGKAGAKKEAVLQIKPTKDQEHEKRMKLLDETRGVFKDVLESDFYDDRIHGKRAKEFLDKLRKGDV